MSARNPTTLDRLVEVRAKEMEDRQRHLADAIRQQEQVEQAIAALDRSVEEEISLAAGDLALAWTLDEFVSVSRARRADMSALLKTMTARVDAARDSLHAAYTDWKAVDTVRTQRREEQKRQRARREQAALDETATVRAAYASG